MKLLSQTDLCSLALKKRGNIRTLERNIFRKELDKLSIGEALFIEKGEWPGSRDPSKSVNGWFKKNGGKKLFTTRSLQDDSGWTVSRIR